MTNEEMIEKLQEVRYDAVQMLDRSGLWLYSEEFSPEALPRRVGELAQMIRDLVDLLLAQSDD